jgi:hypothetical protein
MLIKTTVHIHIDTLDRLSRAAERTGVSRKDIISAYLRRFANDRAGRPKPWSRVRYQGRDLKEKWRKMHVTLNQDEYEFFLDLRKVFKASVSRCIAIALEMYEKETASPNQKEHLKDNYPYRNYVFAWCDVGGVLCWVFYWGLPRQFLELPREPGIS